MPDGGIGVVRDLVRAVAHPLTGAPGDYDPLLTYIGDARVVLLGEATHGTHEFYRERARITKRLIREKGFTAVAVEADWPDAWRVNRYAQGQGPDKNAATALSGFRRFPAWMWRNTDVLDFIAWLRAHNKSLDPAADSAGFYGLDLYSLHTSIEAVLNYLDRVDTEAAQRARQRYGCFDHFGEDAQACGYAAGLGLSRKCESEVVAQLLELQRRAADDVRRDGRLAEDDFFYAQQNARLVKNAELYYRTMFRGRVSSWNLRDEYMANTLEALIQHLALRNSSMKVVVWAHNSHLGDARATSMGHDGEWNLGQLARQRYGRDCVSIGFSTYSGTVTAAASWDAAAERKAIVPAFPGSYEALFHATGIPAFLLAMPRGSRVAGALSDSRLERAIGVVYQPATELASHYFSAQLAEQFDAVIHFDETRGVEPLDSIPKRNGEPAETFPSGV